MNTLLDLSPRGWGRVIFGTLLGTVFCIAVALFVDSFNYAALSPDDRLRAALTSTLIPILLAGPMLFAFLFKMRQLAWTQHALEIASSTDPLTGLFNRRAFVEVAEAYLASLKASDGSYGGALLVVDADDFKAINDRFGHDLGDQALRLIAATMKATLRKTDLIGRIGGEEFGILLPGSSPDQSAAAADRLCRAISDIHFSPEGRHHPLSISIGAAVFSGPQEFLDLFRVADRELYAAKQNGRNRVSVSPVRMASAASLAA